MKLTILILGLLIVSEAPSCCLAQVKSVDRLKKQIDSLYTVDQQVQQDIINQEVDSLRRKLFQRQLTAFRQHKPYLIDIVNQHGFPGYNLVGRETSNHFFILVQHCDDDSLFQQRVLTLMKPEVDNHNADGQGFAYLTDRVLVNGGKLQLYGTRLTYEAGLEGKAICQGVRCVLELDQRRAQVGLGPIRSYLDKATALHRAMNAPK